MPQARISKTTYIIIAIVIVAFAATLAFLKFRTPEKLSPQAQIAAIEKRYGPDDARLINPLTELASADAGAGDYDQAIPLFQRALAIGKQAYGADAPDLFGVTLLLAETYDLQGKPAQADPLYARLRVMRDKLEALNKAGFQALTHKPKADLTKEEALWLRNGYTPVPTLAQMVQVQVNAFEWQGKKQAAQRLTARLARLEHAAKR